MGQLYVRRISRGVAIALADVAIAALIGELLLMMTFPGMIISLFIAIVWRLWIAGDAIFWLGDSTQRARHRAIGEKQSLPW
jgi:hypothetical protein